MINKAQIENLISEKLAEKEGSDLYIFCMPSTIDNAFDDWAKVPTEINKLTTR